MNIKKIAKVKEILDVRRQINAAIPDEIFELISEIKQTEDTISDTKEYIK